MELLASVHIHGIHPRSVHFPIALFISAMGLDIVSLFFKKENLHRTAVHIYVLATILTPLVVLTGLSEAAHLGISHPVLRTHQNYAYLTTGTSVVSLPILWLINRRNPNFFRAAFLIFLTLIVIFVSITGHNGGRMVYEYGVGVDK